MIRIHKLFLSLFTFVIIGVAAALPTYADPIVVNGNFSSPVPSNGTGGGWTSANIDGNGGGARRVEFPGVTSSSTTMAQLQLTRHSASWSQASTSVPPII